MKSAGYVKNAVKRITVGDTFDAFAYPWNMFRIPATPFSGSSSFPGSSVSLHTAVNLVHRVLSLLVYSN